MVILVLSDWIRIWEAPMVDLVNSHWLELIDPLKISWHQGSVAQAPHNALSHEQGSG